VRDTAGHGPRRLLVVDDDPAICALLADLASSFGYLVDTASVPSEIDTHLGRGHDLVMLDLSLGETDGMRVMRQLGERQPGANLVLLTGADVSVLSGARRVAEMSGFNVLGAVGKPAPIAELEALFRSPDLRAGVEAEPDDTLEHAVFDALDHGRFHLLYQPILDIREGTITGAEALLRMSGSDTVSPEVFIPLIEEAGRTGDLLHHVFRVAAADRAAVKALSSLRTVSINLSVLDLADLALPETAAAALGHAAPPDRWVLEITETAEVDRLADALDVLIRLRLKGFMLSMDDFGSGSSTLHRLRDMPFTSVKADRRFMQTDFNDVEHAASMLRAAVDLGAALGMRVVAEGIETAAELQLAREVGCDYAQGYHIGKPVRAEAFGVLVASWSLSPSRT
jgi:EAL domain-containing protein (putative c-di-GMP-specific phosphodiesterase class I)/ActR/RegA family two-component response regulator